MEDYNDIEDLQNLESLEYIERQQRLISCDRGSDLDYLDDRDFISKYRLNKQTVEYLVSLLDTKLRSSERNNALSTEEKICLALHYYATGSFQIVVGDTGYVSQSTISRVITDVSKCLAELAPSFIKLPETEMEQKEISQQFYEISRFPNVYGVLDCTHIPIANPGGEAERFRCWKSYFSINVQTLCDANLFIRDIVVRWPGSTHDSTIFDNSHLRAVLETDVSPIYHVLGDNGYGCRPYLLTPFLDPSDEKQRRYNASHIKARNTVERMYGLWKRRFNCLSIPLRCSLNNNLTIIMATSVLHNVALLNNDIFCETDEDADISCDIVNVINNTAGIAKRNAIVEVFF